ncbi:ROK family protein [Thalassospira sp. UBA4513]|uniref:ROK family protein n=1 Tax=Thalassospira sp. UBA4513 TaxID=1947675 RepID=UPI00257ECC82|nr:ROK family protein [Thalassospira sp. UBA4513]|tara:strand:+ start:6305 stop:7225 length:921 start_codon:yes stop_codon:yes gene_type:complete
MQYAFDIGGSNIEFSVFDAGGAMVLHHKASTPRDDRDAFVKILAGFVHEADEQYGRCDVGISLAGGMDPQTGSVISANIPAIKDWPLAAELSAILDRPVLVENDADCFALAEATTGAAQNARTVFAIILGTGVGGGIVFDGQFVGGNSGIRGEWGHGNDVAGSLIKHGLSAVACGCGRTGCLDSWGGARGLERIYAQLHDQAPASHDITTAWLAGDEKAARVIDIYCDLVARELALMVNVFDPDCVPVGGGLASETALIAEIDTRVRKHALGRYDAPLVVPGAYARDGGLRGAALLHRMTARPKSG